MDTPRLSYYSFSLAKQLTLGTPERFRIREKPRYGIEVRSFAVGSPCAGFLTIHGIYINGKNLLKKGPQDAVTWISTNIRRDFEGLKITAKDGVEIDAEYTGSTPAPYDQIESRQFCATFRFGGKTDELTDETVGR